MFVDVWIRVQWNLTPPWASLDSYHGALTRSKLSIVLSQSQHPFMYLCRGPYGRYETVFGVS